MVRKEFGSGFLAITRINDLDKGVMQNIKGFDLKIFINKGSNKPHIFQFIYIFFLILDEAVSKFLPIGVSPQFGT